jgi:pimeloyl-ACP methyl ester carboxylesterase
VSDTYVLVHGAWHTGAELEPAAENIRKMGHTVHCPTLAGNRPGDDRARIGLADAVQSLCDYLREHDLRDVRLVGHSYGGMVISKAVDVMPERIRRLVYVNAFVPLPGESLNDMVPPHYVALFDGVAAANKGAVMLPFPIWREAFINDADLALATSAYERLNPHPYKTFTDKISLKQPLAALQVGKSYVNCMQDVALPHSLPWHPRLSERLGLFRLIECMGSHEIWFTDPQTIGRIVVAAGRD